MKIAIFTTMPKGLYSGGRYLAQILAYALNQAGEDVVYLANNDALFDVDFAGYDAVNPLRKSISKDYELPEGFVPDWIVVIPTGSFDQKFYNAALEAARKHSSRVALLSFETPNWFNALSPFGRSAMPTESWRQVIARGGAVITIAQEGIPHAKSFFGQDRDDIVFDYWHPPINDLIADQATPIADGRKRLVTFVRTEDQHKGAHDLLKVDPAVVAGHTLSMVFGRGVNQSYVDAAARHFGQAGNVEIELQDRISDSEKFNLLASASALLFPSYFEGFGYPPVEAAYMGVPSVAYDLPLLHETVGQSAYYAPIGDTKAFSDQIAKVLADRPTKQDVLDKFLIAPDTYSAGTKFADILRRAGRQIGVQRTTAPAPVPVPSIRPSLIDTTAQSITSRLQSDLLIETLKVTLNEGVLRLTGTVSGKRTNRRLRFQVLNAVLPDVRLTPDSDTPDTFDISCQLDTWPANTLAQTGRVLIIEQGGKLKPLGSFEIPANLTVLLQRRFVTQHSGAKNTHPAAQALFVVRPQLLAHNEMATLHVAALAHAFAAKGNTTQLNVVETAPRFDATTEIDFLPIVDRTATVDPQTGKDNIAQTLADGGTVIVDEAYAKNWHARARATSLGPDSGLVILHTAALPKGFENKLAAALSPATLYNARRSVVTKQATKTLVLNPPQVISALPDDLCLLLAQARAHIPSFEVVIPRRFCAQGHLEDPWFSGTGAVVPQDEATLQKTCEMSGALAFIGWGGASDILLQGQQEASGLATRLDVADGVFDIEGPVLPWITAAFTQTPSLLEEALSTLATGAARAISKRPWLNKAYTPGVKKVIPTPLAPVLSRTNSLCFTAPKADSRAALRLGWGSISESGAAMKKENGVVSFCTPRHERRKNASFEILLNLRGLSEDAQVFVYMNETQVGTYAIQKPGHTLLNLVLEPEHWNGDDDTPQYLVVRTKAVERCLVLAMSLSDAKPDELDWDAQVPPSTTPALQRYMLPSHFAFHDGQVPKGLLLRAGWHRPEQNGSWSGGDNTALGFNGTLAAQGPIISRLQGRPHLSYANNSQTVGFSFGISRFAQAHLDTPETTEIAFALPHALCQAGIDTLFMDFKHKKSPKELGISDDERVLSYFMEELSFETCVAEPAQTFKLTPAQKSFAGASLELAGRSGVLRLTGNGPAPKAFGIGFVGSNTVGLPQALSNAGWSVDVPLPDSNTANSDLELVALSMTDKGCIAPLPEIETVEFYPVVPRKNAPSSPARVSLNWSAGLLPRADAEGRIHTPTVGINFGDASQPHTVLGHGWGPPEATSVWSIGPTSALNTTAGAPDTRQVAVLTTGAFITESLPQQQVRFGLGDATPHATVLVQSGDVGRYLLPVPRCDAPQQPRFEFPDATSPFDLGLSADIRKLGLSLTGFHVENLAEPTVELEIKRTGTQQGLRLTAVGQNASAVLLEITAQGPMPAGIRLADQHTRIVHPTRSPASGFWTAELLLEDLTPDKLWDLETVYDLSGMPNAHNSTRHLCQFQISSKGLLQ